MITVLDLKYLKGEYLDYVRISFSLLLEYWMKRMVLCFFFSPDEKTNLQEEKKELCQCNYLVAKISMFKIVTVIIQLSNKRCRSNR